MATYSVEELSRASGVSVAAIRHYVRNGVLPPATPRGPKTRYDDAHLHRLIALGRLRVQGLRLEDASRHIASLSADELRALAGAAPARDASSTIAPYRAESALPRQLWEHIVVCPGVELCVRADADTEARRVAREIEAMFVRR